VEGGEHRVVLEKCAEGGVMNRWRSIRRSCFSSSENYPNPDAKGERLE